MKLFRFDGASAEGQRRFEYLFHGLMIAGHMVQSKGLDVLRRENDILQKLEAISYDCECGKIISGTAESDRKVNEKMVELELDEKEVDLLYNYIANVPWSTGTSARGALSTLDWLKTAGVPFVVSTES